MKAYKKILIAFLLNLFFSFFELVGGILTGSTAILSDAIHDLGDALSIGFSCFLERKSYKSADATYSYGYRGYSVLGGVITTLILILGSIVVIINAISRIINPVEINYKGMIIFALIGVLVNFLAAYFTSCGDSLNQKAVNLHMLEDVLGWLAVLISAVVMFFTDLLIIDSIISICVAIFILTSALKTLKTALDVFLWKTPQGINLDEIKQHLMEINGIVDVHHIHVWSIDGQSNFATMHIVVKDGEQIKAVVRDELQSHGIEHVTIEIEDENEICDFRLCEIKNISHSHHCHNDCSLSKR